MMGSLTNAGRRAARHGCHRESTRSPAILSKCRRCSVATAYPCSIAEAPIKRSSAGHMLLPFIDEGAAGDANLPCVGAGHSVHQLSERDRRDCNSMAGSWSWEDGNIETVVTRIFGLCARYCDRTAFSGPYIGRAGNSRKAVDGIPRRSARLNAAYQ